MRIESGYAHIIDVAEIVADSLTRRTNGFLFDVHQEVLDPDIASGVCFSAQYDPIRFSPDFFHLLNVTRPKKLSRAVNDRLAEFLAGRALTQVAQSALGREPEQVSIGLDRAAVWPKGLAGSISDSHGRCVCLLMPLENGQPGIDIEHIAEGRGLEAIMRNTVNPLEARKLQASRDIATAATLCFSGKEALYKALFPTVGRFFGFSSAALDAPPLNNQLSLRLTETLHSSLASGMEFDIFYRVKGDHVMTWLVYQPSSVQRSS